MELTVKEFIEQLKKLDENETITLEDIQTVDDNTEILYLYMSPESVAKFDWND